MANQPRGTQGSAQDSGARNAGAGVGEASGRHHGLYRPGDEQRVDQTLDKVGLDDRGDMLEDEQRDRRSRGAAPSGEGEGEEAAGKG